MINIRNINHDDFMKIVNGFKKYIVVYNNMEGIATLYEKDNKNKVEYYSSYEEFMNRKENVV